MHIKVSLSSLNCFVLLLATFLLPFTGIAGLSFLGELQADASAHVILLIGLPLYLYSIYSHRKLKLINNWLYILLLLFIAFTFFISLSSVTTFGHEFKEKTGYEKFAFQFGLLLFFGLVVSNYFYSILSNYSLEKILLSLRKSVKLSYIVVCTYAFFESLHIFGINTFTPLLQVVDQLIRNEVQFNYLAFDRIRSVSPEPPFLTLYLVFAVPWLLSYFLTNSKEKLKNWLLLISIILLVYFSGSRSGLVIITIEVVLFFALQLKRRVSRQKLKYASYIAPLFLIVLSTALYHSSDKIIAKLESISVKNEGDLQVSSISRWGTQDAALQIALDNPVFGVGFGQQGFYFPKYYPKWAYDNSYEIREWANERKSTWPPGFSMFTRLAAETGFLNAIFFFVINLLILIELLLFRKKYSSNSSLHVLATICAVVLVGYILVYLQWDSFRLIGYWLVLSLSFAILKNANKK